MALFLSDEWFAKVETLSNEAGDLHLPPTLQNILINVKVIDDNDEIIKAFHLKQGRVHLGLDDNAMTTVLLKQATIEMLLVNFDMNDAMEAFINGEIRVEGDMSQLMALHTSQPTDEQKQLIQKIKAMTQF